MNNTYGPLLSQNSLLITSLLMSQHQSNRNNKKDFRVSLC